MNRNQSKSSSAAEPVRHESILSRAQRLIEQRQYGQALDLVQATGHDPVLRNIKGVCLLRLGKPEAAVSIYREMVFKQGCVWVRPEVPTLYKVNFATALLLSGKIEGGLNVLSQAMDETNPGVQRLRQCIQRWKKGFSIKQRLSWWFGGMSDAKVHIPLDFEPGLIEDGVVDELPSAVPGHRPAA